ncbi:MAG: hypothetical protein R8K20_04625 [Gallionellaceae bacterium]
MGFYQPLFIVSVEHMYFTDGLWKGLDFVPCAASAKLIHGAGILLRHTKNGIGVFYETDKSAVLRMYAQDSDGSLRFNFKVYAKDRTFANYTAPSNTKEKTLLCFDSRGGVAAIDGEKISLSKEEFASEKDFVDMDALLAEDILAEQDRRRPPDFVLSIFVEAASSDGFAAKNYGIKFNTRQSIWKYHLLGNMNRSEPFIIDLDNRVEFEYCGEVILPDNKPSKVFRSKALIPLLEKSNCRFQLKEPGPGSGKVLIKRLPVASQNRLGMEVIDGKSEIVLESFVNY